MAEITQLPVMTGEDAETVGFAKFNGVPHLPIDIPDGGFTITAKTSEGRRLTLYFGPHRTGGPPKFVDVQFHDRGSTIPDGRGDPAPTFDSMGIGQGGKNIGDTRKLPEADKQSILVLFLETQAEEAARGQPC